MPQNSQFVCEGCHKEFNSQNDLQKHQQNCTSFQAKQQQGAGAGQTYRAAGGQMGGDPNRQS